MQDIAKFIFYISLFTTVKLTISFAQIALPNTIYEQYDLVSSSNLEGYYIISKDGKQGLINQAGEVQFPPTYHHFYNFSEDYSVAVLEGKYGFIDKQGKRLTPLQYNFAEDFSEDMAVVNNKGKFGFINRKGKLVIPMLYDHATSFRYGVSSVQKDGKRFYINSQNQPVFTKFEQQYDKIWPIRPNKIIVQKNQLYGLVDSVGQIIFPPMYEFWQVIGNTGRLILRKDGFYEALTDMDGNFLTDFLPQIIRATKNPTQIIIRAANGESLYNTEGKEITAETYEHLFPLTDTTYLFETTDKKGIIDITGKIIQETTAYNNALLYTRQNFILAKVANTFKVLNQKMEVMPSIPFNNFVTVSSNENFLVKIQQDTTDYWGILDRHGQQILAPHYQSIDILSNYLFLVKDAIGKTKVIDNKQQTTNFLEYEKVHFHHLRKDVLLVQNAADKWGLISIRGKQLIPIKYEKLEFCQETLLLATQDGRQSIVDVSGKILIPDKYASIVYDTKRQVLTVSPINLKRSIYGQIDINCNRITPFKYDKVSKVYKSIEASFTKKEKVLLLDKRGVSIQLLEKYDELTLNNELFLVRKGKFWGMVDRSGEILVPIQHQIEVLPNIESRQYLLKIGDKYGSLSAKGDTLIPFIYDDLSMAVTGNNRQALLYAKRDNEYGLVNQLGKVILPFTYPNKEDIGTFTTFKKHAFLQTNFVKVKKGGYWHLVNLENPIVLGEPYEKITFNYNGFFEIMTIDGKKKIVENSNIIKTNNK